MTQPWKADWFRSVTSSGALPEVEIHPQDAQDSWPNKPSFLWLLPEDKAGVTPPALGPCVIKAPTVRVVAVDAFKGRLQHSSGAI